MATESKEFVTQMFDRATDSFQKTMQTGVKMQEEALKFWTGSLNFTGAFDDVRQRMERVTGEFMPLVQKNVEQCSKAFDEQCKGSMSLMTQAFDAAKNVGTPDVQKRAQDFIASTFDTLRNQADAFAKVNTQAMESFSQFVHKAFNGMNANGQPANPAGQKHPAAK